MKEIIIFGINDFSRLISYYLQDEYNIIAYTIDKKFKKKDFFLNKPVVDFDTVQELYNPLNFEMFIALGYSGMNELREKKFKEAKEKGYNLVSYIHPSCCISKDFKLNENVFIFENVTIQPFVEVSNNVFIWSNAIICHDTKISENVFIGANATINGFVEIQKNSFIGAGAIIRNNISIAENTLIGAGCTILKGTQKEEVYKNLSNKKINISSKDMKI